MTETQTQTTQTPAPVNKSQPVETQFTRWELLTLAMTMWNRVAELDRHIQTLDYDSEYSGDNYPGNWADKVRQDDRRYLVDLTRIAVKLDLLSK